jgi:hypothetical protein
VRKCWKLKYIAKDKDPLGPFTADDFEKDCNGKLKLLSVIHEENGSFTVDHKAWIPHVVKAPLKLIKGYRKNSSVARGQAIIVQGDHTGEKLTFDTRKARQFGVLSADNLQDVYTATGYSLELDFQGVDKHGAGTFTYNEK